MSITLVRLPLLIIGEAKKAPRPATPSTQPSSRYVTQSTLQQMPPPPSMPYPAMQPTMQPAMQPALIPPYPFSYGFSALPGQIAMYLGIHSKSSAHNYPDHRLPLQIRRNTYKRRVFISISARAHLNLANFYLIFYM